MIIKKICKSLIDQSSNENAIDYKDYANELIEILRTYDRLSIMEIIETVKFKGNAY